MCRYVQMCHLDPDLDFDEKLGATTSTNADLILDYMHGYDMKLE